MVGVDVQRLGYRFVLWASETLYLIFKRYPLLHFFENLNLFSKKCLAPKTFDSEKNLVTKRFQKIFVPKNFGPENFWMH